ncbi:MAG TPA: Mur ligase family protein [Thermoanaerobaculia bacterium]|jgi:cyanophycin synthetase
MEILETLGPSTAALVRAAEERDIPWIRLDEGSLIQLGYGRYQKRIQATLTSETKHIATQIAADKRLTHRILGQLGLPVGEARQRDNDYRILVVNGRMVAAAHRIPDGTAVDVTDAIHEDNRLMAERAVQAIGLDVGGVDFISPDISRSYEEAGGFIVEINPAPDFRMHLAPTEGAPRDVAGPVLDMLFPAGAPRTIPVVAVTGTHGKTTTTRMVGHVLKLSGYKVGLATTDGVYVDGVRTVRGDMTDSWASQIVLRDPTIDAAVLETARDGIARSGLGWRRCNVGAVLNVASDHLDGVEDLDDLARVQRVVVEVARDFCVLNADDERVARMAEASSGEPIYVTMDPKHQRVRSHVRAGGRAVSLEPGLNGRMLVLYHGERQLPLLWARQIPAALEGRAGHNIQNAMFAAAIAHGLGVAVENIRQGLRTFSNDFKPGLTAEPLAGTGELAGGIYARYSNS